MSMLRHQTLRLLAATALALPLFACGILPKKVSTQVFAPQVHVAPDPAWPQVAWQLAVARPSAIDMIDSRRIAVSPTAGQIQVYKGVAWDDTVPDIVQSALVETFEDSGRIAAVSRMIGGTHADYVLHTDLRDYQAVYKDPKGPPQVVVTIRARLTDAVSNRIVTSNTFHQEAPAVSTSVRDVAAAFDTALSATVHDVVGWTLAAAPPAVTADPKH